MKEVFKFKAKVWLYPGDGGWRFAGVPKSVSEKIKKLQSGKLRRGWGAVKVKVVIGKSEWVTSIFPDSRSGTYLLPLKKEIRKKEGLLDGEEVSIKIVLSAQ